MHVLKSLVVLCANVNLNKRKGNRFKQLFASNFSSKILQEIVTVTKKVKFHQFQIIFLDLTQKTSYITQKTSYSDFQYQPKNSFYYFWLLFDVYLLFLQTKLSSYLKTSTVPIFSDQTKSKRYDRK